MSNDFVFKNDMITAGFANIRQLAQYCYSRGTPMPYNALRMYFNGRHPLPDVQKVFEEVFKEFKELSVETVAPTEEVKRRGRPKK